MWFFPRAIQWNTIRHKPWTFARVEHPLLRIWSQKILQSLEFGKNESSILSSWAIHTGAEILTFDLHETHYSDDTQFLERVSNLWLTHDRRSRYRHVFVWKESIRVQNHREILPVLYSETADKPSNFWQGQVSRPTCQALEYRCKAYAKCSRRVHSVCITSFGNASVTYGYPRGVIQLHLMHIRLKRKKTVRYWW